MLGNVLRRLFGRRLASAVPEDPVDEEGGTEKMRTGRIGEDAAVEALERAGYVIVERNVRAGGGELDIVAVHDGMTVYVEVKTCREDSRVSPFDQLSDAKARTFARAALAHAERAGLPDAVRADVVAVRLEDDAVRSVEIVADCIDLEAAAAGRRWRL